MNFKYVFLISFLGVMMIASYPSLSHAQSYQYLKVQGHQLVVDYERDGIYTPYVIKAAGYSLAPTLI